MGDSCDDQHGRRHPDGSSGGCAGRHKARLNRPIAQADNEVAHSARRYLAARRARARYFPGNLFADPAWDILLDLYAAREEGTAISVTSACIAADVPSATALRWISKLERIGYLRKFQDPSDGRRSFLEIEPKAADAIRLWLRDIFQR